MICVGNIVVAFSIADTVVFRRVWLSHWRPLSHSSAAIRTLCFSLKLANVIITDSASNLAYLCAPHPSLTECDFELTSC